jgi:hypothetical protein
MMRCARACYIHYYALPWTVYMNMMRWTASASEIARVIMQDRVQNTVLTWVIARMILTHDKMGLDYWHFAVHVASSFE